MASNGKQRCSLLCIALTLLGTEVSGQCKSCWSEAFLLGVASSMHILELNMVCFPRPQVITSQSLYLGLPWQWNNSHICGTHLVLDQCTDPWGKMDLWGSGTFSALASFLTVSLLVMKDLTITFILFCLHWLIWNLAAQVSQAGLSSWSFDVRVYIYIYEIVWSCLSPMSCICIRLFSWFLILVV